MLDFGWDIKVYGSQEIYLENPSQKNTYYGKLKIQDAVLASSNGSKRRFWNNAHHLVDIKTGKSHDNIHTVFCYHNKWMFADGFATLLSVSPKEVSKRVMKKTRWLEAFIIYNDGSELRSGRFLNI